MNHEWICDLIDDASWYEELRQFRLFLSSAEFTKPLIIHVLLDFLIFILEATEMKTN